MSKHKAGMCAHEAREAIASIVEEHRAIACAVGVRTCSVVDAPAPRDAPSEPTE